MEVLFFFFGFVSVNFCKLTVQVITVHSALSNLSVSCPFTSSISFLQCCLKAVGFQRLIDLLVCRTSLVYLYISSLG